MNDDVHRYKSHNGMPKQDSTPIIREYARKMNFKEGDMIIDIGSGDGSLAANVIKECLPKNISILLGSDISKPMVQFANENYGDDKLSFVVLDIGKDLPKHFLRTFDHVISSYTLHWVKDQEKAYNNLYNLLKVNGECLVIFLGDFVTYPAVQDLSQTEKWAPYVASPERNFYPYHGMKNPEKELERIMTKAGFTEVHTENMEKVYNYKTMEAFKSLLLAVDPCNIPAHLEEEYIDDFVSCLEARGLYNHQPPNTLTIKYNLIVGYGKKK